MSVSKTNADIVKSFGLLWNWIGCSFEISNIQLATVFT